MLSMTLGLIIHREREQEIERDLVQRRLIANLRRSPSQELDASPAKPATTGPSRPARHEGAGAAS